MPKRPCAHPACPRYAEVGNRCREHAREQRRLTRSPNNGFYASKHWRVTRRRQLFNVPLCEFELEGGSNCGRLAEEVHHIVPIEDGGDRYAFENLRSLCKPHHSAVHRRLEAA